MSEHKFTCTFCGKSFARERTIEVHLCEQKRRFQQKDEQGVRLGFNAFLLFNNSLNSNKQKKYEDFSKSSFYNAFVKFGRYCVDTKVINVKKYTNWLLQNNKKIDTWASDHIYTQFLVYYLRTENVTDALYRSIESSLEWENTTGKRASLYLEEANVNILLHHICKGKISPWVIYNSNRGHMFLSRLTPDQLSLIWPYIDSDFWQKKFNRSSEDVVYIKNIMEKAGW